MKTLFCFIAAAVLGSAAQAQLLTEHFDYNNGSLGSSGVGDTVWGGGDSPSTALIVTNAAALTNSPRCCGERAASMHHAELGYCMGYRLIYGWA